jgi:dTDP-4-dehydrorhamnose 3,5-epimerase
MKLTESKLGDAKLVEVEPHEDEHGYFTRTIGRSEFAANGLAGDFIRSNYCYKRRRGALQGIHYRPTDGPQIVRCVRGAIHVVIVDMRPNSSSYAKWDGFDLTERNGRLIYIPVGFGHGFQTLADDTEVIYQFSRHPTANPVVGVRYDDPTVAIRWPEPVTGISQQDASWPLLSLPPGGPSEDALGRNYVAQG